MFEGIFETMSTSSATESMGTTSSSSRRQSTKQRGIKRLLSESILEDKELQKALFIDTRTTQKSTRYYKNRT
ncbi:unnamed protein product [Parnassius mnemosyne]|uniref:Uncharacterized protein n=1 Tax=Parnassius mnemosyne TaxID=213953 RepID=A0AAV1MAC9_9NEOP